MLLNDEHLYFYTIEFHLEIAALHIHIATLCPVSHFLVLALPKQPLETDSCLAFVAGTNHYIVR